MEYEIKFFFRKKSENFHSIEELFNNFQSHLQPIFNFSNVYLPYHTGFLRRIKNVFFARKNKSLINHITGDVNYISLGLPKENTVITIHDIGSAMKGTWLKKMIIGLFWFKIPLKRVEKITVISEFSKNELIKKFKINPYKIKIIPNCVSDKFQKTDRQFNSAEPNILVVGTKENKNLDRIIEALKNIKCKVFIIGKLSESQHNKLIDYKLKFENFHNLEFDKLVSIYKESDLLLFPSLYEGFGIPILEAQATGIPVITSNLQPMNYVAGEGAMTVNPFNVFDISEAVHQVISNQDLRNTIVEKGFENVKKYRCKQIAEMYCKVYNEIIKNAAE